MQINYQLDGSNNTESDRAGIRLIPISNSYVQEVQQVSNGFAPEFGNTVGTVFNTVTKSGTNEYHSRSTWRRKITERFRAEFFAETTNLTNTLNAISLNSIAQVASSGAVLVQASGAVTGARDQRRIQLGLRLAF
jgi:hypothetical protein